MGHFTGSNANDTLAGTADADVIEGFAGSDSLDGGAGADELYGAGGNDYYIVDNAGDRVFEAVGDGSDIVFSSVSYALAAGQEVESLGTLNVASTAAIGLTGNEFANRIVGNAGSNSLDGGGGADELYGEGGNDYYIVDNGADRVFENVGGGFDIVFTSVSFVLAAGQEVESLGALNAASTAAIDLTGNAFANRLVGNAGSNGLNGGGGADDLYGEGGNDFYVVDDSGDRVFENAGGGNDTVLATVSYALLAGQQVESLGTYVPSATSAIDLTGNELTNRIVGNAGSNSLNGGGGADELYGEGGNDYYIVDNAGDRVFEGIGGGSDIVFTSVSYALATGQEVESLGTLNPASTATIDLTGNEFANRIVGNAGSNSLNGGAGADELYGEGGNDYYIVDNAGDRVFESVGGGSDIVFTSVSYALTAGQEVESLGTLNAASTASIDLAGNAFANRIVGNAGSNSLDGGGAADELYGEGGNDYYIVDNAGDRVFEAVGGGSDIVFTTVSFALAAGQEVESLGALNGASTAAIDLTGNEFTNRLVGNAGSNGINGGGGADDLYGEGGDDRIDGGAGGDRLSGGEGVDEFHFTTTLGAGNVDMLLDFDPTFDRIVLGGASGQPFAALGTGVQAQHALRIGSAAVDADDRLIYNSQTGALSYDADGSGSGAAVQFALLPTGLTNLFASNFTVTGPPNQAATITSGTTATIAENSTTSTIVYQVTATDPEGDTIGYSLGGPDAAFFSIDSSGAVRFVASPDFETRQTYDIMVRAVDSADGGDFKFVRVNVTDVAENAGPTPIIQETSGLNNSTGAAQTIDRGLMNPSTNANLFDDDLPSATIQGTIATGAPNADIDFFAITLNAGERLILDVDNTSGTLDALVRIYDSAGTLLGFVDDSPRDPGSTEDRAGTTLDSFLSFRAPNAGTYYFSVESWGEGSDDGPGTGTTTGSYDLHVSIGPPVSSAQAISEDIDALIGSNGWPDPNPSLPGTNLTYAFPNSPADYPSGTSETQSNFEAFNAVQQNAATQMLQQFANIANLTFTRLLDPQESGATLRYAMSDEPDVAYAYLPGGGLGGTAWFRNSPLEGRTTPSFDNPVPGGYGWMSILHESGHALGLKHGHEFPAVSFERDSVEYTMMTYRSFVGDTPDGYVNETWGFPSTPMMLDIAAIQRLYGANFSFNSTDTVYTWSPTSGQSFVNGAGGPTPGGNRIFMTVWDGGGTDTYNLSNYSTDQRIDLRPGEFSLFSQTQVANLGQGHFARGNVGNAYLFNGDPRSLIENAVGGSGSDVLIANQAANGLTGGSGSDRFRWVSLDDGGPGAIDHVTDFQSQLDRIDLSFLDANPATAQRDAFHSIGTNAFSGAAGELRQEVISGSLHLLGDANGDQVADFHIVLDNVTTIATTDILF